MLRLAGLFFLLSVMGCSSVANSPVDSHHPGSADGVESPVPATSDTLTMPEIRR